MESKNAKKQANYIVIRGEYSTSPEIRYDLTFCYKWEGLRVERKEEGWKKESWDDRQTYYVNLYFVGSEKPVVINCQKDREIQQIILKRIDQIKGVTDLTDIKQSAIHYVRGKRAGEDFNI